MLVLRMLVLLLLMLLLMPVRFRFLPLVLCAPRPCFITPARPQWNCLLRLCAEACAAEA